MGTVGLLEHAHSFEEVAAGFDGEWDGNASDTLDRLILSSGCDPETVLCLADLVGRDPRPSPLAAILELHVSQPTPARGLGRLRMLLSRIVSDAELPGEAKAMSRVRAAELARPVIHAFLHGHRTDLDFDSGHVLIEEAGVVLFPGVHVPLRSLMKQLATRPSELWAFRNAIAGGREFLESEFSSRFELYRVALEAQLERMLHDSSPGAVQNYFEAFPLLLDSPMCRDHILRYLCRRQGLNDGLEKGLVSAWLQVLGKFRVWSPTSIRELASLNAVFGTHPDEMTDAILSCITTAQADELSTSVAALSLMALARSTRERRRLVTDIEREERIAGRVGSLPNGRVLIETRAALDVLGFCHDREGSEWDRMGEFERTRWRGSVASLLSEWPSGRRAFVEFVTVWMPRELYEGTVPLLGTLMRDDLDFRHVEWIAANAKGAPKWRAEALVMRMELMID